MEFRPVYALPRGATSFVIRLPGPAKDRSLYFVNQNAAAQGQLLIAVSNQPLVADSPFWSAVEGAIRFRHKRLFAVSLVGVEAKYVRLTFQVEASDGDTKNDFPSITYGAKIRGHLTPLPCRERSLRPASRPRPQRSDHKPFPLRSTSWREPCRVDLPSRASRFCGR